MREVPEIFRRKAWVGALLVVAFCLRAPSLPGHEPLPENGASPANEVGQDTPPSAPEPPAQPPVEPEPKAQSGAKPPPPPREEPAPSTGPGKPPVVPLIGEDLLRTLTGGDPAQVSVPLKILGLLTVLSLVPSIVLLTTCFPRIVIVLSFLRRAIGTQDLPPNQVIVGLALFLTILVMAPVWREITRSALEPYRSREIGEEEALQRAVLPLKRFMVERTLRSDLRLMVGLSAHGGSARAAESGATPNAPLQVGSGPLTDLPITVVAPAFILSELKTAFQMGFVLYLPFVLIDLIVSTALISMGMLMLPPVLISLPFKVLIFVLVDGWNLVVQEMVRSLA